jgi:hypothetical protein
MAVGHAKAAGSHNREGPCTPWCKRPRSATRPHRPVRDSRCRMQAARARTIRARRARSGRVTDEQSTTLALGAHLGAVGRVRPPHRSSTATGNPARRCDSGTEPSDTASRRRAHRAIRPPAAHTRARRGLAGGTTTAMTSPRRCARMLVTDIGGRRLGRTERGGTTLPMRQPVDQEELRRPESRSVRHASAAEDWRARSSIRRRGRSRRPGGCRADEAVVPRRCPRCRKAWQRPPKRHLCGGFAAGAVDVGDELTHRSRELRILQSSSTKPTALHASSAPPTVWSSLRHGLADVLGRALEERKRAGERPKRTRPLPSRPPRHHGADPPTTPAPSGSTGRTDSTTARARTSSLRLGRVAVVTMPPGEPGAPAHRRGSRPEDRRMIRSGRPRWPRADPRVVGGVLVASPRPTHSLLRRSARPPGSSSRAGSPEQSKDRRRGPYERRSRGRRSSGR